VFGLMGSASAWATTSATRTTSAAYDAASGLVTQQVIEPNTPSLRLETDVTYDAFGNKTQLTVSGVDIATRTSTITYSGNGRFAASRSNPLGQSESWGSYDSGFGTPLSHTGPNGLTTTWSYDGFGRKTLEVRADGTRTKYAYLYCSGVNGGTVSCPANGAYLVQATPLASDGTTQNGPQTTTYFDQRGRVIAKDAQGFDGGGAAPVIRVLTQYDALGRVASTSRPYAVSGDTPRLTVATYDVLGRVTSTAFPDGSTTATAYHGLSVTVTDQLGHRRTTVKNDQGKVASVSDATGKISTYGYDPFGNLIEIIDPLGNVATYSYDTRGRKVAMSDPDMGAWTYGYDTLNEPVSQTDAKGQATTFQYDNLGRLTQRVETDMTCVWTYDTASMGIGKLASAAITSGPSPGYQRSYTYDSLGRPSQVTITVDGASYAIGTTYDANGRLSTASYPSGLAVTHVYTALGYETSLTNSATGQVYWTAKARDAELHLTQQQSGNGVVTNQSFDPNTGHLISIQAGLTGTEVENFSYSYDSPGDLLSRGDANFNLSETFQYDALRRLTSSTITAGPTKTFAYDALGNITAKSDVGLYSYPPAGAPRPHAVTNIGENGTISTTFTYDANGNQTGGLGRNIQYASFNLPTSIAQGTANLSFTHDTEHQRLKQVETNGGTSRTTLYLVAGPVYVEKSTDLSSTTWNEYLVADGGMVAVRFNNVTANTLRTRYFHKDHLGSISVLTDENAGVVQRLSYDPWGKQRNATTWADDPSGVLATQDQTRRGYTGHEQLVDVGLVHMNGRVYDPQLGRFISADPFVQDPFDAQSLNRYAYVYDNPLTYTDPSGYFLSGFFHAISHFFHHLFHSISRVFHAAIDAIGSFLRKFPIIGTIFEVALAIVLCGPTAALCLAVVNFASSAFVAGVTSGSIGQAFKAGFFAAISPYAQGYGTLIGGLYGPVGAIIGAGVVGGALSALQGGKFYVGFAISAGITALTVLNLKARENEIEQSSINPDNASGQSEGFYGDRFKLGGVRETIDPRTGRYLPCGGPAGGCQGGPGSFLGLSYGPGSLGDKVVESFSGPHDFLEDVTGSYDSLGNNVYRTGFASFLSKVKSAALVIPAIPLAASALVGPENSQLIDSYVEKRKPPE
jgi:RHS repeat-associated protein